VAALLPSVGALVPALVLAGCGHDLPATQGLTGTVAVAGSSSLAPLVRDGVEEFLAEVEPGVTVRLDVSGTGAGLARLCPADGVPQVQVVMASRPLTAEESDACAAAGVQPADVVLATDAVVLVVPARNDYVRCLTTTELADLWSADDPPRTWADVREDLPPVVLVPYAPGPDGGTADVFAEEVLDGADQRGDAARSEDDAVVVEGVATSPGGVGYVPLSYALRSDRVRPVAFDAGDGCVTPGTRTVADGSYPTLRRELRVVVDGGAYADSRSVRAFVDYLHARSGGLARRTGMVPRTEGQRAAAERTVRALG
jgi:phosphate transport system substrate-binding protein